MCDGVVVVVYGVVLAFELECNCMHCYLSFIVCMKSKSKSKVK